MNAKITFHRGEESIAYLNATRTTAEEIIACIERGFEIGSERVVVEVVS